MSFVTPSVANARELLTRRYPGLRFGIYHRRMISGKTIWSQHSWPNALDLYYTVPYADDSGAHQAKLEVIARYCRDNFDEMQIRYLLWRVPDHHGHIHMDFWPKGYGSPAASRGGDANRYKTKSGKLITQAQLVQEGEDDLALLSDEDQRELMAFLQHIRDMKSNVGFVKHAIQNVRDHRAGGPLAPAKLDLDDYEIIIQRKEV